MEAPALPTNLTPRVLRILEEAGKEAERCGHDYVGTEHVMLALITVGGGVASEALAELGASETVRTTVREIMESDSYRNP